MLSRPPAVPEAQHRTQHRDEHQRHGQRGRQRDDHRDGQILHELPHQARPEQQGQEHRQRGQRGGGHRPGHALGGTGIGVRGRLPLRQAAVRHFGDDDGAIHQHADHQDQAEQHHDIERIAEGVQDQDRRQEGAGNGDADQQRGARTEGADDDDHHQQNRGHDVVLQIAEHVADLIRLVLHKGDLQVRRPLPTLGVDDGTHRADGVDDVGADPLLDLQRHRRLTADPSKALRIFEVAPHARDVAKGHHAVPGRLHRHREHVVDVFDNAGHLHDQPARAGVHRAGGDQQIVVADEAEQLAVIDAVGLHDRGVHDHLHQRLAVAADVHLQHAGQGLDAVLEIAGDAHQTALRKRTGQGDGQHREQRDVDLVHARFVGGLRQLGLGNVHALAHVRKRPLAVETGVELQLHRRLAFPRRRGEFLHALDRLQLLLHRPDQQAFRVLRGDAVMRHRHIDDRHRDVRFRFLRNRLIGAGAGHQDEDQRQQHRAAAPEGGIDEAVHNALRSSATGCTASPVTTKP